MKNIGKFGCLVFLLGCVSAATAQWVIVGAPTHVSQNRQAPTLSFIPESVDVKAKTVVVKRENDVQAFHHEIKNLGKRNLVVNHVLAQRHYLCAKRQFHTPAAQYLTAKNQVVYEYDYRTRHGLLFQVHNVDGSAEAEQMLFRRVCAG